LALTSGTRLGVYDKGTTESRPKGSAYAKRTTRGRFKEMDDVGRSQKADKPRKAKKTVRRGCGDQGDKRTGRKRSVARSS
jgi:hypothetical protein